MFKFKNWSKRKKIIVGLIVLIVIGIGSNQSGETSSLDSSKNKSNSDESLKNRILISKQIDSIIESSDFRTVLFDSINNSFNLDGNFKIIKGIVDKKESRLNDTIQGRNLTYKDLLIDFEKNHPYFDYNSSSLNSKYYDPMSRLMRELNPNLGYYDALNYENVSDGVRLVIDESESVNLSDELRKLLGIDHDYELKPLYYDIVFDHMGRIIKNKTDFTTCISGFRSKILRIAIEGYYENYTGATIRLNKGGKVNFYNSLTGTSTGEWSLLCSGRFYIMDKFGDYSYHDVNSKSFTIGSTTYSK
mgnify:CR=1 FL=1